MILPWLALLASLRAVEPPVFPAQVLPDCTHGLDPHDPAVQPWPRGPAPEGYRLSPPSQLHLLAFLGFVRDDLLLAVNDLPLGSAARLDAAWRATEGAAACRWRVRRGDAELTLAATIAPGEPEVLVRERGPDGLATRASRRALWQRLSDPYAWGRYPSTWAMSAEDGVYAVDDALQALLADLGLRPLDHLVQADGTPLRGGQDLAAALGRMLTEPAVTWSLRRGGQALTLALAIEGPPIALPVLAPAAEAEP